MFGAMSHSDALERFRHEVLALLRTRAAVSQRQLDIFVNGQVADQVETLEDKADLTITNAGAIGEGEIRYFVTFERITSVGRRIEQPQDRQ